MTMRYGRFEDFWRGHGLYVSLSRWTVAVRLRWRFAFVRPPGKPGYVRLYVGPIEIERRNEPANTGIQRPGTGPIEVILRDPRAITALMLLRDALGSQRAAIEYALRAAANQP